MNLDKELAEIKKRLGVEASEFKMPPQWKIVRKPEWSYGLSFERDFTVYEHRDSGYTVSIISERHRAMFVNDSGEDVMGFAEKVVEVNSVEAYKHRLGTSWRIV